MRALVLHGFRMNGDMMRDMMRDVRETLQASGLDWEFIDAPLIASGPAFASVRRRWPGQTCFEFWNAVEGPALPAGAKALRIPSAAPPEQALVYQGATHSLAAMKALLVAQPIDLLVGYSQGAAMLSLLTALLEGENLTLPHAPWRGVMLLNSGAPIRDRSLAGYFERKLCMPSLHVGGGPSDITHAAQTAMLEVWAPESQIVLAHGEGHIPPTLKRSPEILRAMKEWVSRLASSAA